MFGLTGEERFGDKQGEVCVAHVGGLEHVVEIALHLFPDGVAVGFDYHAAAHCALFGQIGLDHQFVVPL